LLSATPAKANMMRSSAPSNACSIRQAKGIRSNVVELQAAARGYGPPMASRCNLQHLIFVVFDQAGSRFGTDHKQGGKYPCGRLVSAERKTLLL
jgi:hypothetical protein